MSPSPAPIILPVESQVRELDAKLLLACAAAERGFPVYIGSRRYINYAMTRLPRGVFVAKSLRAISARLLRIIRALGHDVVAWDEESLVRFPGPDYYPWRFSPGTFAQVQHLFAWGEDDAQLFRDYHGNPGIPVHITGNPRCDLLRPELRGYFREEVDVLRRTHGAFILVNTNFSFVNNFVPALNLMQRDLIGDGRHVSRTGWGMRPEFASGMADHQQRIHDAFQMLLPRLARWFPDHRIILRAHPSENHAVWQDAARGAHNVHVLHEGSVVPWIMASSMLLHNGCTTAVESALLGVPTVSYQPVTAAAYDYALPNGLGYVAHDLHELRVLMGEILSSRRNHPAPGQRETLLRKHVAATTGALAVDRIIEVLVTLGYLDHAPPRPALGSWLPALMRAELRTIEKQIHGLLPGSRGSAAYHAHRFPALTKDALNDRIGRLSGLLGRFRDVRAAALSDHVFMVASSHNDQQTLAA